MKHGHFPTKPLDQEFCLEKAPAFRDLWLFLGDGDLTAGYLAWREDAEVHSREFVLDNAEFIYTTFTNQGAN